MATVGCPPGYACPPPTQVDLSQVEPSGGGWRYLYTAFEQVGNPDQNAVAEFMDFEFEAQSNAGLLAAFQQQAPAAFWSAWRQTFVNAGSDMYIAKVFVQPPSSFPGTATYRIVVVHSLAYDTFLDFVADLIGTVAKSPFLIIFLGIIFFGQTLIAALRQICSQVIGDYCHPAGAAKSVYLWIAVVGAVVSIGGYLVINQLSKHEGLGPVVPPAPPGFGTPSISAKTGVQLGPLSSEAGVSGGGGGATSATLAPARAIAVRGKDGRVLAHEARQGAPAPARGGFGGR